MSSHVTKHVYLLRTRMLHRHCRWYCKTNDMVLWKGYFHYGRSYFLKKYNLFAYLNYHSFSFLTFDLYPVISDGLNLQVLPCFCPREQYKNDSTLISGGTEILNFGDSWKLHLPRIWRPRGPGGHEKKPLI